MTEQESEQAKKSWERNWLTRFIKFVQVAFDLLFISGNKRVVWHPLEGSIISVIWVSWTLTHGNKVD